MLCSNNVGYEVIDQICACGMRVVVGEKAVGAHYNSLL